MKHNWSWDSVCVVGIGGHAKDKLLPALNAVDLNISGLVSRNPNYKIKGLESFLTISEAILKLPKTTLFIVSSPPNIHYSQVKELIEAGRDVFVEKPAFLSLHESNELTNLALKRGVILVEMLMYLENRSVQQVISELKRNQNSIKNIKCEFLIPSIPKGTFRTGLNLGDSLLSDMSCYPLSLLTVAGFDLSNLSLVFENNNFQEGETFYIEGKSNGIKIQIKVGLSKDYINSFIIRYHNNNEICCEPFFYARDGSRNLTKINGSKVIQDQIYETNSYELMFKRKRPKWLASQKKRFDSIALVSETLERLGIQAGLN